MLKFCFAGVMAACEILDVPPTTVSALWRANCCRECENGDRFAPSSAYFWTHFLRVFPFFGGNFSPNTKAECEI